MPQGGDFRFFTSSQGISDTMMGISGWEMAMVALIGLLLFGKKLPEVARNVGKTVRDFKKGMTGFEDDMRESVHRPSSSQTSYRPAPTDERDEVTAPKFEPPKFEPMS